MYLKNKRVLVLGLGVSGLSTVKALNHLGAEILISDSKSELELKSFFKEIANIKVEKYLQTNKLPYDDIDLIIKSPGIPLTLKILKLAKEKNIEIITDIELASRISKTKNIIAITGTNGKTTTTTLVGQIFEKANYNTYLAGNIGIGILENMINAKKEDAFIIEASSFQLENTLNFKPKISLILNIRPDHLDWHKTFDNYIQSKKKIFKNQDKNDFTILNYDDEILRAMDKDINSKIIWFSSKEELEEGIFIKDKEIIIREDGKIIRLMSSEKINLIEENALGSIGVAWAMGIDIEIIKLALSEFKSLEHRLEYVDTRDGINFYNDSKGTNPDASIKAIEVIKSPIILIAGGSNKGSSYKKLIQKFDGKVKELILLGQTKEIIKKEAEENGFKNIHLVKDMKEAVKLSYKLARENENVLLSPACASWDMYKNFEERGIDFKNNVISLGENKNG